VINLSFVSVSDHPLGAAPENPVYIESPGLEIPILSFQGDVMFRRIAIAFFSLNACLIVAYQVDAQQAPSAGAQPPGARGRAGQVFRFRAPSRLRQISHRYNRWLRNSLPPLDR